MGWCDTCPTNWSRAWCQWHGPGLVVCGHATCTGFVDTDICCEVQSYNVDPATACKCPECAHDGAERGYDETYKHQAILFQEAVEKIFDTPALKKRYERELQAVRLQLEQSRRARSLTQKRLSTAVSALYKFMYRFVVCIADPHGAQGMDKLPIPQRCSRALAVLDRAEERGFDNALYVESKCAAGTNVAVSGRGGKHDSVLRAIGGAHNLAYDSTARAGPCRRRAVAHWDRKLGICVDPSPAEIWMSGSLTTVICAELKALSRCGRVVLATNWANPMRAPSCVRLPHYRYFLSTMERRNHEGSLGGLRYRLARYLHALAYLEVLGHDGYGQFLEQLPSSVAKIFATRAEVASATPAELDACRVAKYLFPGSHELTAEDRWRAARRTRDLALANPLTVTKRHKVLDNAAKREALRSQ